jgi:hypothetical protein
VNPFLFIVGCARSGTTLLRRMLDSHPDLAVIDETRWVPKLASHREFVTGEGLVGEQAATWVIEHPRFPKWGIEPDSLLRLVGSGQRVSYPQFVTGFFDLYGEVQGKSLVGDKTPRYVRHLQIIHSLWPHAKILHIIRDGRDTALSILGWVRRGKRPRGPARFPTWAKHPVATVALWWEWHVRQGREAGMHLGPQLYHEVPYESLVARPAEESARLCEFLGLPYDDAMLRYHEGRERRQPGLSAKKAWRPVTAGLRDWRSEMPAHEVERFEAIAGDTLSELGYDLAFTKPPRVTLEEAAGVRAAFTEAARARGKRLPDAWAG